MGIRDRRYAVNNTGMREILSTYQHTTTKTAEHPDGITLTSTLKSRMSGNEAAGVFVQGGKTGYTIEAVSYTHLDRGDLGGDARPCFVNVRDSVIHII